MDIADFIFMYVFVDIFAIIMDDPQHLVKGRYLSCDGC